MALHPDFMLNMHPTVVHYPVALLTAAFIFEVLWLILRRPVLDQASAATLVLGTLAAVLAVATGLIAGDSVPHPEAAHETMEAHETLALITFGLAAVLSIWRVGFSRRFPRLRGIYSIGILAMALLITYVAHLGGRMVYRFGVGGTAITYPAEESHEAEAHGGGATR